MDWWQELMSTNFSELTGNVTIEQDDLDDTQMEMLHLLEEAKSIHDFASTFTVVAISILLALGIPGNCLVIFVSLSTQRVINHPVHSMLVVNLAISDIIYLLCSAPYQAIAFSVKSWIYGATMCPIFYFLSCLTMAVSIFTMCSLAVMRFIGLMMPYRVHTSFIRTSKRFTGWLIIGIVWIFSIGVALPNAISYRLTLYEQPSFADTSLDPIAECSWDNSEAKIKFTIALIVLTFLAPFLLVTILYFFIGRELLCVMSPNTAAGKNTEQSEYRKTTQMVCGLVVVFVLCWFPHNLYSVLMLFPTYQQMKYLKFKTLLEILGYCFSYAHACINPIIYTFGVSSFRHSVYVALRLNNFRKLGSYISNICPQCCSYSRQEMKSTSNSVELNTFSSAEPTYLTPASSFQCEISKSLKSKSSIEFSQSQLKENLLAEIQDPDVV